MKHISHSLPVVTFLALIIGLPAVGAEPSPAPSTVPSEAATQQSDTLAHWREVADRLGDDSFTKRKAAQKELDTLTFRQMGLLHQLADAATDDEVKTRLQARITQIEEELAISPPPISLNVDGGSLSDVAAAFGKSLEVPLETWPPNGFGQRGGATWTLSVKDKPFWEVFFALQKQHGFSIQNINEEMRLMQQGNEMRVGDIAGGLAVFPQSITRSKSVNFQQAGVRQVQSEQMFLSFMAVLDPRVPIASSASPELTYVVDDVGNILFMKPVNQNGWNMFSQPTHIWNQSTPLSIPEKMGHKIASAKGSFRVVVQLATEKMEVTDLDKKLNVPLKIGNQTVTIQQFEPRPNNNDVRFQLQCSAPFRANQPGSELDPESSLVTATFVDANGQRIWSTQLRGGAGGNFGGQFVPPLKMVMTVPTKLKEVTIPFELKDLPLP